MKTDMSRHDHEPAIELIGLSKRYDIYDNPRDRLLQGLSMGRRQFFREFWVLRDINLEVYRGETFGIVGRNGAGKSTLLQIISGVLMPTTGAIHTRGRITALLELGAGLNPEFNGIENIKMSAAVLGMSEAELDRKMDHIIGFAALGDFIKQPVKHYSSGMIMRLAFSVAINFDPDILIVDEALAVGDELFQLKCIRRIQDIKESGATILFVSHSTHTINQICDRAVLLDGGRAIHTGNATEVSSTYNKLLFSLDTKTNSNTSNVPEQVDIQEQPEGHCENRLFRINEGNGEVRPNGRISEVGVVGQDYRNLSFQKGETAIFEMIVTFQKDTHDVIMGMMISTPTGVDCYHTNLLCREMMIPLCKAGETYSVTFEIPLHLSAGSYIVVFDCQYGMKDTPKLVDIFYEALKFTISPVKLIEDGGIAALSAKVDYRVKN